MKSGDSTSLEPCFQETLNSAKGKDIYERYKVNKEVDYPTFRKSLIDGIKNNFRLRVKEHLATQLEDLRCIPTKNRINHELLVNPTFFDFIKDERLSADKKESKSGGNSYKWQGDIVEVDTLYSSLIKGGFLPENTAEDNFKALFSGVPIRQISPLEWLGKTNLLAYLIDQLYILHKFPLNTNYWSIAQTCFANIKDLKQAKDNYLNNKSKPKPLRHEKIDLILESLAKGK